MELRQNLGAPERGHHVARHSWDQRLEHWSGHFSQGHDTPRASMPELVFTASLEESRHPPPLLKTIEPSKGTSLEVKCSTILDCITRSPDMLLGFLLHALLPRRRSSSLGLQSS